MVALLAVLAFLASFIIGLGRADDQPAAPARRADDGTQPMAVPDSRVRVQVLNGSSTPGLARLATDQLRDAGFDVVSLGNARSPVNTSVVFDRAGKPEIAERVAHALGITRV